MAIEIALLPPDELSKAIFCGAITIEFMFLALRNYSSEIENEIDAEIWVHVRQFVDYIFSFWLGQICPQRFWILQHSITL
jgi:hypothetical protein